MSVKRVQCQCIPKIPNHFWKGERSAKEREEIEGRTDFRSDLK